MAESVLKYHALGNDYLVLEAGAAPTPVQVRLLCDRHRGIGSDGVLFLDSHQLREPFPLRIFNPDGGEAERSGNGLRIFAQYLRDAGHAAEDTVQIRIPAGLVRARYLADGIEVEMGLPDFRAGSVPFLGLPAHQEFLSRFLELDGEALVLCGLSLGNPHAVMLLPEPLDPGAQEALARRIGPRLERDPRFPKGVNLEVVEVLAEGTLGVHIWERGAGYTLASGSGATAAAAAARRLGLVGNHARVEMPGGVLIVDFNAEGRALLQGPVQRVFSANLDASWLQLGAAAHPLEMP